MEVGGVVGPGVVVKDTPGPTDHPSRASPTARCTVHCGGVFAPAPYGWYLLLSSYFFFLFTCPSLSLSPSLPLSLAASRSRTREGNIRSEEKQGKANRCHPSALPLRGVCSVTRQGNGSQRILYTRQLNLLYLV